MIVGSLQKYKMWNKKLDNFYTGNFGSDYNILNLHFAGVLLEQHELRILVLKVNIPKQICTSVVRLGMSCGIDCVLWLRKLYNYLWKFSANFTFYHSQFVLWFT